MRRQAGPKMARGKGNWSMTKGTATNVCGSPNGAVAISTQSVKPKEFDSTYRASPYNAGIALWRTFFHMGQLWGFSIQSASSQSTVITTSDFSMADTTARLSSAVMMVFSCEGLCRGLCGVSGCLSLRSDDVVGGEGGHRIDY